MFSGDCYIKQYINVYMCMYSMNLSICMYIYTFIAKIMFDLIFLKVLRV